MFGDFLAQAPATGGATELIDKIARTPLSQVVAIVAVCTVLRLLIFPKILRTPPHKREGGHQFMRFMNEALDAIIYAGVFVFMLIRPFGVQTFTIPSGSMVQTLQIHDYIVANKAVYRYSEPQFGDIVVFRPPVRAVYDSQLDSEGKVKVDFIKRLLGTPGDVIEIKDGVLYRNGQAVNEPYKNYTRAISPAKFQSIPRDEVAEAEEFNFKLVEVDGKVIPLTYNSIGVNYAGPIPDEFRPADDVEGQEWKELPAAKIPPGYLLFIGDNRNGSSDGRFWGLVPRSSVVGRSEFVWFPPRNWGRTR